ncbi:MAG: 50S ribosomal protein L6 [Candidatus Jorgensenbacteria bacterium]|nr:50S ribosomal protein L6 [Candidatus Jorgensenbacteria bacterium]
MSKIGIQPVIIPEGITITVQDGMVEVKGKKGTLQVVVLPKTTVKVEGNTLSVIPEGTDKQSRANWGTLRALIANAVEGQMADFKKTLLLEGVGFRVTKEGEGLTMNLGFSHPVKYAARPGITFEVGKNSTLIVTGMDKALVGQVAAEIRALKKPEPYKGKGFHYADEVVARKAGKKAATAAGGTT